mgnify:FL=1
MIIKIIIALLSSILFSNTLMATTLNELNNPTSTVFDITQDTTNLSGMSISQTMQEVDKITVAIDKITSIFPREVLRYDCPDDVRSNTYCPVSLSPCADDWDYADGNSVAVPSSDTDIKQKVIEYYGCNYGATGTSYNYGCNYGATATTTNTTNNYSCNYSATATTTSTGGTYSCNYAATASGGGAYCAPTYGGYRLYWGPRYVPGFGQWCVYEAWGGGAGAGIPASGGAVSYSCPSGGNLSGTTCIKTCSSSSSSTTYSCPSGGSLSGTTCIKTCSSSSSYTTYSCPSGGSVSGTTCLKTCSAIAYSCPSGGSLNSTTCIKTCDRMVCPSGSSQASSYNAKATTTVSGCPILTVSASDLSNLGVSGYGFVGTITMSGTLTTFFGTPKCLYDMNGMQDVAGSPNTYFGPLGSTTSYSCPSGGSLSGTVCNLSGTSNCSVPKDYTYYNYSCPDALNAQGYNYIPINTTIDNGYGGNNPSSITNNCKRLKYLCQADLNRPCSYVGTVWQCSPFVCDLNKECGTAKCINGAPVTSGTDYDLSPLAATINNPVCNSDICDAALYEKLGRCGMPPKCPTAFGVYEENGNCYQDVCPPEATEKELGKSQTSCLSLQCPSGYIKNASGGCDAQ